jgi:predicted glutamine amidotransferase
MARLFAMIGNRPDLGGRALGFEADPLRVRSKGTPLGWGIGFYQGGEVLMRRRPIDDRQDIDVAKLAADVRADLVIGHVRSATVGALRTENTHPFRYRQWLYAQTGTLPEFDQVRDRLVSSVPEFLRGGIRGETDAEMLFHVFLSFLHDAGRLNDTSVETDFVREALRSCLAVVDGITAEVGGSPSELNLLVANGDAVVAVHRSNEMRYRVFSGKSDAELLIGDDLVLRRKTPELAQMHILLLASDFDEPPPPTRWKPVAQNAMVTLTRGQDPKVEAL